MSRPVPIADERRRHKDNDGDEHMHDRRSRSHSVNYTAEHSQPPDIAVRGSSLIVSALGGLLAGFSPTGGRTVALPPSTGMAYSPTTSSVSSEGDDAGPKTPVNASSLPVLTEVSKYKGGNGAAADETSALDLVERIDPNYSPTARRGPGITGARRSSWAQPTSPGLTRWLALQTDESSPNATGGGGITSQPALGLFRRMSIGSVPKPAPMMQPPSAKSPTVAAAPGVDVDNREGRDLKRRGSNARKLSPMSERMLRGHYLQ